MLPFIKAILRKGILANKVVLIVCRDTLDCLFCSDLQMALAQIFVGNRFLIFKSFKRQ
jgi:hypothetical protein